MIAKAESLASFLSRHLSSVQFRRPGDLHPCPGPLFILLPGSLEPSPLPLCPLSITVFLKTFLLKWMHLLQKRWSLSWAGEGQTLQGTAKICWLCCWIRPNPPLTSYFRGIISPVPRGVLPHESGCPHGNRWIWTQTTGGTKSGVAPLTTSSVKFILTELFIFGSNSQGWELLFLAFLANSVWVAKQDGQHL